MQIHDAVHIINCEPSLDNTMEAANFVSLDNTMVAANFVSLDNTEETANFVSWRKQ